MKEIIITLLPLLFGAGGVLYAVLAKIKTANEKLKDTVTTSTEAVNPLMDAFKTLTEKYNEIIQELIAERTHNMDYIEQISSLRMEIKDLTQMINRQKEIIGSLKAEIAKLSKLQTGQI